MPTPSPLLQAVENVSCSYPMPGIGARYIHTHQRWPRSWQWSNGVLHILDKDARCLHATQWTEVAIGTLTVLLEVNLNSMAE